jgi:hypothetical protein
MRKGKDRNIPVMPQSGHEEMDRNMAELNEVIREYRNSVRLEADRPDFFWARQCNAIMERLHRPESPKHRRALLWVPAAVAVVLCLFFFAESSKAPTPDLAAGYDQELLIEVERALSQTYPDALAPAWLVVAEIERNNKVADPH